MNIVSVFTNSLARNFFLASSLVSVSLEPLQDVSAHIVQVEMKSYAWNILFAFVDTCPLLLECNLFFPKILTPRMPFRSPESSG